MFQKHFSLGKRLDTLQNEGSCIHLYEGKTRQLLKGTQQYKFVKGQQEETSTFPHLDTSIKCCRNKFGGGKQKRNTPYWSLT